jgi:septation ring formation regulator EzrA
MIDERLRKIENIIEKLQLSILEKIGSYGQNLESVKKEINLMQDSFSKFVSKR